MTTPVLDTLVGGILPHVHFKKVVVEDAADAPDIYKIIVQMELYQRKDELLTKTWLKDLDLVIDDGPENITSIFDFLNLNIVQVQSPRNMQLLRKSNPIPDCTQANHDACKIWDEKRSIFVHKGLSPNKDPWVECFKGDNTGFFMNPAKGDPFAEIHKKPISLSALIGTSKLEDVAYEQGKVREEVYNGKVYYAIPFEHVIYWRDELTEFTTNKNMQYMYVNDVENDADITSAEMLATYARASDLGIAAYVSLDLAPVFYPDYPFGDGSQYADQLNMEGPISAEIILQGGKVPQTREMFVDHMGKPWSGPVHYHSYANPGAKGYMGYMTGEFHTPDQVQVKLDVVTMANTLVHDFTDPLQQKIPSEWIQEIDGKIIVNPTDAISSVGTNYKKIEDELGIILSPLQKEKKKYLLPDNDTEYSKLYITQDLNGSANAMFYIDMYSLLKNNSQLFPYLRNVSANTWTQTVDQIIGLSKIIDMSIHRTRINSTYAINGYEEFEDDKATEPPARKVVCGQDHDNNHPLSETYANDAALEEMHFSSIGNKHTRYFAFSDYDVARRAVGTHKYSAKIKFYDGTQAWLRQKLQTYMSLRAETEAYYRLATSSRKVATKNLEHSLPWGKKQDIIDKVMQPYYDDRYKKFHFSFAVEAEKHFNNGGSISGRVASAIREYSEIFNFKKPHGLEDISMSYDKINKLMMPGPEISGSPKGILICTNILRRMCTELEKILGGARKKKPNNSNELQDIASTGDYQQLPAQEYQAGASTIRALIEEEHSWDHPNEIFKAVANKNVYIDYLSLEPSMETTWSPGAKEYVNGEIVLNTSRPPVKRVSSAYFKKRCKADLAKYTNYALYGGFEGSDKLLGGTAEKNWYGVQDGGIIAPVAPGTQVGGDISRVMMPNGQPDTLNRMMYSYLTPSIVEISDPTKQHVTWKFLYTAFNPSVFQIMQSGHVGEEGDVYSNNFHFSDYQNSNLIAMANYSKNRNQFGHADLSDSFPSGEAAIFGGEDNGTLAYDMTQREAYKSYFSKYNITVHESSKYGIFFGTRGDKEPGVQNHNKSPWDVVPGEKAPWPFSPKEYSDGKMRTDFVLKGYSAAANLEKVLELPKGKISLGTTNENTFHNLPNVYKLQRVSQDFYYNSINTDFLRQAIYGMVMLPGHQAADMNAQIFFNFNMVAKIEKLAGYSTGLFGDSFSSLAVDDQWTLLKETDMTSGTHFCRISFYDKKLVGDIDSIPIVDKYFILMHGVDNYELPKITPFPDPADIPLPPEGDNYIIWEAINHEKLQELITMFEKGLLQDGAPPVLNLPPIGRGDPSPIDMTSVPVQDTLAAATNNMQGQAQGANVGIPAGGMGGYGGGSGGGSGGGGGGGY